MKERIINFIKSNCIWIFLIFGLLYIQINMIRESNRVQNNNDKLRDSIRTYKLKNDAIVASKSVVEYDLAEAKQRLKTQGKSMDLLSKKFTKIKTVVQIVTVTKIDTMTIAYEVPVPIKFERSGSHITKDYNFDYNSNENGFEISNLSLNDTISIIKGSKRKWLLGKQTNTIDINHSNPYITDIQIDAYDVIDKPKWYNSKWTYLAAGILGGAIILK